MWWLRKRQPMIFYISGEGNDRNLGTHPTMAWATIDRVNRHRKKFIDGDRILFKRGYRYKGKLFLRAEQRSWPNIHIGNYGSGYYPQFDENINK